MLNTMILKVINVLVHTCFNQKGFHTIQICTNFPTYLIESCQIFYNCLKNIGPNVVKYQTKKGIKIGCYVAVFKKK